MAQIFYFEGMKAMFEKKIEFFIKTGDGATVKEVLDAVEVIKEAHPNAKISVEVVV